MKKYVFLLGGIIAVVGGAALLLLKTSNYPAASRAMGDDTPFLPRQYRLLIDFDETTFGAMDELIKTGYSLKKGSVVTGVRKYDGGGWGSLPGYRIVWTGSDGKEHQTGDVAFEVV